MALNITGNIQLDNSISISSMYCRTEAELSLKGNSIYTVPYFWSSEEAYENNKQLITPQLPIDINYTIPYDRVNDGADILQIANEYIKFVMESQGYTATIINL